MAVTGLHYFPDTLHYRQSDLATWLPELHELGVGWLALRAESSRAVPEFFLRSLIGAGITPILQFQLALHQPPQLRRAWRARPKISSRRLPSATASAPRNSSSWAR